MMEVLMTVGLIAANVIINNFNNCMLGGSIYGAGSCSSISINFSVF